MNASSDRKKPPVESRRQTRAHPHRHQHISLTRPTAKVQPERIVSYREGTRHGQSTSSGKSAKYYNWYPASSSTEENEGTFNLDVEPFTGYSVPQWRDSSSCSGSKSSITPSTLPHNLPLPPLAQPCTTSVVNEARHSEQILLGVRLPISVISTSPLSARPPRSIGRPPRIKPVVSDNKTVSTSSPVSATKESALTGRSAGTPHTATEQPSNRLTTSPEIKEIVEDEPSKKKEQGQATSETLEFEQKPVEPEKRQSRPKVAFLEPTATKERSPNKPASSLPRPAPTILRTSPGSKRSEAHKLSPSAQFPGWDVITDDEEDEPAKDKGLKIPDRAESTEGSQIVDKGLKNETDQTKDFSVEKTEAPTTTKPLSTTSEEILRQPPLVVTVEDLEPSSSPETEQREVPTESASPRQSRVIVSDKERFQIQQEFLRRNDSTTTPSRASGSTMLRQPRKSLAMIFNNLSSNLGFTQKNSSTKDTTSSPVLSQATLDPDQPTPSSIPPSVRASLIELSGSKLLKDKRGHSTLIQLGKTDSVDQSLTYINGDVCRRPEQRGRLGTLIGSPANRASEVNPSTIGLAATTSQRGYLQGDTTTERSLIVDLLCCTCCTKVEEEEAYANLIENHRLARVITLAAVLTILGLILAYIIRSAIETPHSSQTATPQVPASVPSIWSQSNEKLNNDIQIERIRLPETSLHPTTVGRKIPLSSATLLPVTDSV